MANVRAFSWSLAVFAVALGLSWLHRSWVMEVWVAPVTDGLSGYAARGYLLAPADEFAITLRVVVATAVLVTLPIACAEAWLLLCRVTRCQRARRLALPFSLASCGGVLLAMWLAVHAWHAVAPTYLRSL
jgi:Sec-independent protein secretion pathway component TatC